MTIRVDAKPARAFNLGVPITTLPAEVMIRIIQRLDRRSLAALARACLGLNAVCQPELDGLLLGQRIKSITISVRTSHGNAEFWEVLAALDVKQVGLGSDRVADLTTQLASKLVCLTASERSLAMRAILQRLQYLGPAFRSPVLRVLGDALACLIIDDKEACREQLLSACTKLPAEHQLFVQCMWRARRNLLEPAPDLAGADWLMLLDDIGRAPPALRGAMLLEVTSMLGPYCWDEHVVVSVLDLAHSAPDCKTEALARLMRVLLEALKPATDAWLISFEPVRPDSVHLERIFDLMMDGAIDLVGSAEVAFLQAMCNLVSWVVNRFTSTALCLRLTKRCLDSLVVPQSGHTGLLGDLLKLLGSWDLAQRIVRDRQDGAPVLRKLVLRFARLARNAGDAEGIANAFTLAIRLPDAPAKKLLARLWALVEQVAPGPRLGLLVVLAERSAEVQLRLRRTWLPQLLDCACKLECTLPESFVMPLLGYGCGLPPGPARREVLTLLVTRLGPCIAREQLREWLIRQIKLASSSGMAPGMRHRLCRELMAVAQALVVVHENASTASHPNWEAALPLLEALAHSMKVLPDPPARLELFEQLMTYAARAQRDKVAPLLLRLAAAARKFKPADSLGRVLNLCIGLPPQQQAAVLASVVIEAFRAPDDETDAQELLRKILQLSEFAGKTPAQMMCEIARELVRGYPGKLASALLECAAKCSDGGKAALVSQMIDGLQWFATEELRICSLGTVKEFLLPFIMQNRFDKMHAFDVLMRQTIKLKKSVQAQLLKKLALHVRGLPESRQEEISRILLARAAKVSKDLVAEVDACLRGSEMH